MTDRYTAGTEYSRMSLAGVVLGGVALVAVVMVALTLHYQSVELDVLEGRWLRQNDELVELRGRVGRCDSVIDRALDSVSLVRALIEEEAAGAEAIGPSTGEDCRRQRRGTTTAGWETS